MDISQLSFWAGYGIALAEAIMLEIACIIISQYLAINIKAV